MVRYFISISIALTLVGIAASAQADWQYTRWGMSSDEVRTASKGTAVRPSEEFLYLNAPADSFVLVAPYQSGKYRFDAMFTFANNEQNLSRVSLILRNIEDGFSLLSDLSGVYGHYIEHIAGGLSVYKWRDDHNNNFVGLLSASDGSHYTVEYWPISNESNRGL